VYSSIFFGFGQGALDQESAEVGAAVGGQRGSPILRPVRTLGTGLAISAVGWR
jgi:hypothetical protein